MLIKLCKYGHLGRRRIFVAFMSNVILFNGRISLKSRKIKSRNLKSRKRPSILFNALNLIFKIQGHLISQKDAELSFVFNMLIYVNIIGIFTFKGNKNI